MTRPIDEIYGDLCSGLDPVEREAMAAIALRLEAERPPPDPGYRAALRASLSPAPEEMAGNAALSTAGTMALAYVATGLLLLLVAAAGVWGAGPFAHG